MRSICTLTLFVALFTIAPGCRSIQTGVSPVADIANAGGKVEDGAHIIFQAAQTYNATANPSTGQPLLPRASLDAVALAVNKLGHLGLDLDAALGDYRAAQAVGKDLTAARAVVQKVISDIATAVGDVGKAVPPGTLATIDSAAAGILSVLTQVKGVVGL